MELIRQWDVQLLRFLNITSQNPILDQVWLTLTHLHKLSWFQFIVVPVLLFLGLYIWRRGFLKILLALGLTIAVTDTLAYRGVKSMVQRQRPFEDPETAPWVRKVGKAHGPSFPSNHAANCFAGAKVLAWYIPGLRYLFYSFALLIALSRSALGVHFPTDALAGIILGHFVAKFIILAILNRRTFFWVTRRVPESDLKSHEARSRIRRR